MIVKPQKRLLNFLCLLLGQNVILSDNIGSSFQNSKDGDIAFSK